MSRGILLSKDMCPKTKEERDNMNRIPFASAVGSIMYAMICTRPDVSYALSMCSRYQADPGEGHWIAVKNILKYLRRTKDAFLIYGEGELEVSGYICWTIMTHSVTICTDHGVVVQINYVTYEIALISFVIRSPRYINDKRFL